MARTIHWLEALNTGDRVIYHPRASSMCQGVHNLPHVAWVIRASKAKIAIGATPCSQSCSEFDRRTGKPWGRANDYGTPWLTPYSEEEEQKLGETRRHLEAVSALCNAAHEVKNTLTNYSRISQGSSSTEELIQAEAALRQALAILAPKPTPSSAS